MPESPLPLEPHRFEDDEDPDEVVSTTTPLPSVSAPARNWEYRVDALAPAEIADPAGFAAKLNQTAEEGWDLFDLTDAGDRKLLVLRRAKPPSREGRRVGFTPRGSG